MIRKNLHHLKRAETLFVTVQKLSLKFGSKCREAEEPCCMCLEIRYAWVNHFEFVIVENIKHKMLFGLALQFTFEKVSKVYAKLACMHLNVSFPGNVYFLTLTGVYCRSYEWKVGSLQFTV